ncbi:hypothetical protein PoB_002507400 [Plakobranchus ocellatus]|uniref:Secreted protein n=1 Tax=Plakobranchus ocellatus TaxID=259542 RepID=A0AAV3ZVV0_9GAST|nr:hypothetical protein PoB_002507400 [Plakobranchus ocellatus]
MRVVLVLVCLSLAVLFGAVYSGKYPCIVQTPHDANSPCRGKHEAITDGKTGIIYCCAQGLFILARLVTVHGQREMLCSCYTII